MKNSSVKDLDENPLDRLLSKEPEIIERKEVKPKKRKRGRPKEGFQLYSLYMEPEMWAEMKWLVKRLGLKSRSALVRLLISRLTARVKSADYARETAEKNMAGTSPFPPASGRPGS